MPFDSETLSLVSEVARVGMEALTKEKIRSLWEDPTFPGHGLGLISFKHELESRYGEKLSDKYLKNILIEIPSYLQNIIRKKKIDRRNYDSVHGFLELLQMDFDGWNLELIQDFLPDRGVEAGLYIFQGF